MIVLRFLMLIAAVSDFFGAASECNERCFNCEEDGTSCRECVYGWYGHSCNSRCQNCWVSGCKKHSGICVQCQPGRYKEDCGTRCPENCREDTMGNVYCERFNGKCLDGCKTGWWGDTCKNRCNSHCNGARCLQENGHCKGNCESGWWGLDCTKECPPGCVNKSCYIVSGSCIEGCREGFKGKNCLEPTNCKNDLYDWNGEIFRCIVGCKPGWTSSSCSERCPGSCLKCHQKTGQCQQCPSGLYGNNCTRECSMTCNGQTCDLQGRCINGCVDGFRGTTCKEPCPYNCLSCNQEGHICLKCKTNWEGVECQQLQNIRSQYRNQGITGDAPKMTFGMKMLLTVSIATSVFYSDVPVTVSIPTSVFYSDVM